MQVRRIRLANNPPARLFNSLTHRVLVLFCLARFFRVIPLFVVQFGINGDPEVQNNWKAKGNIKDDPVIGSNTRGTITFATSGPGTRTTQMFINTGNNKRLHAQGFSPIGEVIR